jgi:RNA polymerase sigma factor (sigma-70 family)
MRADCVNPFAIFTASFATTLTEPDILSFMRPRTTQASKRSTPKLNAQSSRAKPISTRQSLAKSPTDTPLDDAIAVDAVLCALVNDIAYDNQAALEKFYDATVSRVYGVAIRIVRTPELAEEVISDVYMQVWRDAARYDQSRGRVLGWLLIIARTRSLDLLRKQDEAFSHPNPHDLVSEPESQRDNPEDLLNAAQTNTKLYQALELLSPLQRQLLSLAFFRGLTHAEIVEHTALPLGSVKTHIRRALLVLRDKLQIDEVEAKKLKVT